MTALPRRAASCLVAGCIAATEAPLACAVEQGGNEVREPGAFRFEGRGVWVGGGVSHLVDVATSGAGFDVIGTFPVWRWFAVEGGFSGHGLQVLDHHGERTSTYRATLMTGVRVTPALGWRVRPYLSPRFRHLHYFDDPWGEHTTAGGGVENHESLHRWVGAVGLGSEMGLTGEGSRFRVAVDAEVGSVTGPGPSTYVQTVALLGVGF